MPGPRFVSLTLILPVVLGTISASRVGAEEGPSPALRRPWTVPQDKPGMSGALLGCGLILAAGGLAAWVSLDEEDPDEIGRVLDGSSMDLVIDLGDAYGSGYLVGGGAVALLALGASTGRADLSRTAGDLCRSFLLSGTAVWALKVGIDRERPDGGHYSFPSGHTAAAFSTVPVVARHCGARAALPVGMLACFTGLGRMEDHRHYLSDVLFGAAIGLAAGDLVVGGQSAGNLLRHLLVMPGRVGFRYRF